MSVVRLFENEDALRAAYDEFTEEEISPDIVRVISPTDSNAAAEVDAAVEDGFLRKEYRLYALKGLERGRVVVAAKPDWTYAGQIEDILDAAGAVDQDSIPYVNISSPAPFSDLLGIPVLVKDPTPQAGLLKFDIDSSFGLPLLSNNPTPLSSLIRMPVLKEPKGSARNSAVGRMSSNPAPFSSKLGLPLLTKKRPTARGSAVERLSNNPAPFSRLLSLPVLTKRR